MTRSVYIGIDPGKTGGLALIRDGFVADLAPMPVIGKEPDEARLADWLRREALTESRPGVFAVLEKVGAMPKQGVTSMFNFGRCYGAIRGVSRGTRNPVHTCYAARMAKRNARRHDSLRCKRAIVDRGRAFVPRSFLSRQ